MWHTRNESLQMGRAVPQRSLPPLWGRDRERGTIRTALVDISTDAVSVVLESALDELRARCLSPRLSLSLPYKGGGNRVARTFANAQKCACGSGASSRAEK